MSCHQLLIGPLHPDPIRMRCHGVWVVRPGVDPWRDPFWHLLVTLQTPIWAMLMPFRKGSRWYILPYTMIWGPKGGSLRPQRGWECPQMGSHLGPFWLPFGMFLMIPISDRDPGSGSGGVPTPIWSLGSCLQMGCHQDGLICTPLLYDTGDMGTLWHAIKGLSAHLMAGCTPCREGVEYLYWAPSRDAACHPEDKGRP